MEQKITEYSALKMRSERVDVCFSRTFEPYLSLLWLNSIRSLIHPSIRKKKKNRRLRATTAIACDGTLRVHAASSGGAVPAATTSDFTSDGADGMLTTVLCFCAPFSIAAFGAVVAGRGFSVFTACISILIGMGFTSAIIFFSSSFLLLSSRNEDSHLALTLRNGDASCRGVLWSPCFAEGVGVPKPPWLGAASCPFASAGAPTTAAAARCCFDNDVVFPGDDLASPTGTVTPRPPLFAFVTCAPAASVSTLVLPSSRVRLDPSDRGDDGCDADERAPARFCACAADANGDVRRCF